MPKCPSRWLSLKNQMRALSDRSRESSFGMDFADWIFVTMLRRRFAFWLGLDSMEHVNHFHRTVRLFFVCLGGGSASSNCRAAMDIQGI